MDYTAAFDKNENQIELNKNEIKVAKKNANKRKFVYGLIGICVLLLIYEAILVGRKLKKPEMDDSLCNDTILTIVNCNSTLVENENESKIYDSKLEKKRQFVREMMIDAWSAYERYAWGHGELSPVNKSDWQFVKYPGLSIVASMSSLWTMGLKEEFERGKKWIETELDLSKVGEDVQVSDVIVNYVGGLLSCYALTNEQLFLNKALIIAQLVEPAFNTSTGIPYRDINFKTKKLSIPLIFSSFKSNFQLEFNYLGHASGNREFKTIIQKIQNFLKTKETPTSLYFGKKDIEWTWMTDYMSLFSLFNEFYTSLVKSFIQSNLHDVQSIEMYKEEMDALEAVKMFAISPGGMYSYSRGYDRESNSFRNSMEYYDCYLGAMLAQSASAMQRALTLNSSIGDMDKVTQQNRINRHWHLAQQITRTCQQASDRTKTGLGPYLFYYNETHDVVPNDQFYSFYTLSPELAESNFILWRLTHNEKYQDNAWKMAQAIHKHCRVEGGGYSIINNANQIPTSKDGRQVSIFLSATLKYLYLIFTDDSVLSLDQFVFNSVGHPLPICGNNTIYPKELCKF